MLAYPGLLILNDRGNMDKCMAQREYLSEAAIVCDMVVNPARRTEHTSLKEPGLFLNVLETSKRLQTEDEVCCA